MDAIKVGVRNGRDGGQELFITDDRHIPVTIQGEPVTFVFAGRGELVDPAEQALHRWCYENAMYIAELLPSYVQHSEECFSPRKPR